MNCTPAAAASPSHFGSERTSQAFSRLTLLFLECPASRPTHLVFLSLS